MALLRLAMALLLTWAACPAWAGDDGFLDRASAKVAKGDLVGAEEMLERWLQRPRSSLSTGEAWLLLGDAFRGQGRDADAEDAYGRALSTVEPIAYREESLAEPGVWASSATGSREASAIAFLAAYELGALRLVSGSTEGACGSLAQAVRASKGSTYFPSFREVYGQSLFGLGLCLGGLERGQWPENAFETLIEHAQTETASPRHLGAIERAHLWQEVGALHLATDDFGAAIRAYATSGQQVAEACNEQSPRECLFLARAHLGVAKAGLRSLRATLEAACWQEDIRACVDLSAMMIAGRFPQRVTEQQQQAGPLATLGCEAGDAEACGLLGLAHIAGLGVTRDDRAASVRLSAACSSGFAPACPWRDEHAERVGAWSATEEDFATARSFVVGRTGSLIQPSPDALADFCRSQPPGWRTHHCVVIDERASFAYGAAASLSPPPLLDGLAGAALRQMASGRALLEDGCNGGHSPACADLAGGILLGSLPIDPARRESAFGDAAAGACVPGHPEAGGCGLLGLALYAGLGMEADPRRGLELVQEECASGERVFCPFARELEMDLEWLELLSAFRTAGEELGRQLLESEVDALCEARPWTAREGLEELRALCEDRQGIDE